MSDLEEENSEKLLRSYIKKGYMKALADVSGVMNYGSNVHLTHHDIIKLMDEYNKFEFKLTGE